MTDSLKEFQDALYNNRKAKTPNFPDAYRPKRKSKSSPSNELTSNIVSHLKLNGHQAERVANMGRVLKKTGRYIPGAGTNGSSDVHSTIKIQIKGIEIGLSVKWEVKIGKDKQRIEQQEYESSIKKAKGEYFIVKTFDDYLFKYSELMKKFQN